MKVSSDENESDPAHDIMVQNVRNLALRTPQAVSHILREAHLIAPRDTLYALVKEGTRQLVGSRTSTTKISFHFVFQLLVTHAQFRQLYETMVDFIVGHSECRDVACALELVDSVAQQQQQQQQSFETEKREEAKARILASCGKQGDTGSKHYDSLVGLDLHPRQNAAQGLASLGARKTALDPGTRVVGMIHCDTGEWVEGYVDRMHPIAVLSDASIAVPGARCIGVARNVGQADLRGTKRDGSIGETLRRMQDNEKRTMAAGSELRFSSSTAKLVSRASEALNVLRNQQQQQQHAHHKQQLQQQGHEQERGEEKGRDKSLDDIVRAMPQWFKRCLGGAYAAAASGAATSASSSSASARGRSTEVMDDDSNVMMDAAVRRQFATSNANMKCLAKIGKPHCIPASMRDRCCMVHVHGTEVCLCTRKLMEVPFQAYERHDSNGVVYCFYNRERVFVSCLKEDCCRVLRASRDSMRAMSRVLEECVFSECGSSWRTHEAVVYGGLCKEQRDHIERIEEMKRAYMISTNSSPSSPCATASISAFAPFSPGASLSVGGGGGSGTTATISTLESARSTSFAGPVNIRRFAKVPSRYVSCIHCVAANTHTFTNTHTHKIGTQEHCLQQQIGLCEENVGGNHRTDAAVLLGVGHRSTHRTASATSTARGTAEQTRVSRVS